MNHLSKLKSLEAAEVKDYIKQNISEDTFVNEVIDNKEEMVPFLLSHKFLPDSIINKFQTYEDKTFLVSQFIDHSYTPSLSFMESLIGTEDDALILKSLQSFPSIPISMQVLMRLTNAEMADSATFLIKQKVDFQKPEILIRLLKTTSANQDLIDLSLSNENVVNETIDLINENEEELFSNEFINQLVCKVDLSNLDPLILLKSTYFSLSPMSYDKLLDLDIQTIKDLRGSKRSRKEYYKSTKHEIPWSENLESLNVNLSYRQVVVKNAPKGSKYRLDWLREFPDTADDQELLILLADKKSSLNFGILLEVLGRDLDLIKQVDPELFEKILSPSQVAGAVSDKEKILYLLEALSSKFAPNLRKKLPLSEIPKTNNKRKASYFIEIFQAVKNGNLDQIRLAVASGYSLDKFAEDSNQSSKKPACELVAMRGPLMAQLDKEELLSFCNSQLRIDEPEDRQKLKYTLNLEEAFTMLNKLDIEFVFDNCEDKLAFISDSYLTDDQISSLFHRKGKEIVKDATLLKAYLKRAKAAEKMEFDEDDVINLATVLTAQEMRNLITSVSDYQIRGIVALKGVDGEYFMSKEKIFELLQERTNLESTEFLNAIIERDKDLAKSIVEAYLGGNKELSALTGHNISLKRMEKSKFEALLKELSVDTKTVVDEIFSRGGLWSEFQEQILNAQSAIEKYHAGRVVVLDSNNNRYNSEHSIAGQLPKVKFKTEAITLLNDHWTPENYSELDIYPNLEFKKIIIGNQRDGEKKKYFSLLKEIQSHFPNHPLHLVPHFSNEMKLSLITEGIDFEGSEEWMASFIQESDFSTYGIQLEQFLLLEQNGLMFNFEFISNLLSDNSEDYEVMEWLVNRVGDLKQHVMETEAFNLLPGPTQKLLKNSKLQILDESRIEQLAIEETLLEEGVNFNPIALKDYTPAQIIHLIKFIEDKIDPNYNKLNLMSSNLEKIEELLPYEIMKSLYSLDDKDIISLFNIPANVSINKKIMKGIRDLLTVHAATVSTRVYILKEAVSIINPQIELTIADFLDYSNPLEVVSSHNLDNIDVKTINLLIGSEGEGISNTLMKGKSKADILYFLRSLSAHDYSFFKDTLEMISQVRNGIEGLRDRLVNDPDLSEQEKTDINNTINNMNYRLKDICLLSDVKPMHDQLVPLLGFIKSDPTQPLGQDKYRKLENSAVKDLGYALYFPKSRGDLQILGSMHGWCVNNHRSYGDNVISNGNILVGLCKKDSESSIENTIALAHFINRGKGVFNLEQLKWSMKVKDGKKNENATGDFNHGEILSLITRYLKSYKKDKKEE